MPQFKISPGIPDYPTGLPDDQASLVASLYRAIAALAQQVSVLEGMVQYSQNELSKIDQFTGLQTNRSDVVYPKALEPITYGQVVTFSASGGKLCVGVADRTNAAKPAHAVCDAPLGLATNEYGPCIVRGVCKGISGSTLGTWYYLGTAGAIQAAQPAAPNLRQHVALGLGSYGVYVNILPAELY